MVAPVDALAERALAGPVRLREALVHLRRPSKLSTLTLPDTQPFVDPRGRFAFSHNGDLRDYKRWRPRYRAAGRIHGRADSEVGQRWLEDAWDGSPVGDVLCRLHETFGGHANLAILAGDGTPHAYAGNSENPMFTFRLGRIGIASTGIYSLDRSIFRYVAPAATDRATASRGPLPARAAASPATTWAAGSMDSAVSAALYGSRPCCSSSRVRSAISCLAFPATTR